MQLSPKLPRNFAIINKLLGKIYNLVLPSTCLLCGYPSHRSQNICIHCQAELPRMPSHCFTCGQFITIPAHSQTSCGNCLAQTPPFTRTLALFPYQAPITQFIIAMKFKQQLSYAKLFGDILAETIQNIWYVNTPYPDVILPVPLHVSRLSERGFNQSLEIARPIAKSLGIMLDIAGCKRIKHTHPQSTLTPIQRKQNIANAFSATVSYSGMHLAILDDVMTTGCTMSELAKSLKGQGAYQIDLWCVARRG